MKLPKGWNVSSRESLSCKAIWSQDGMVEVSTSSSENDKNVSISIIGDVDPKIVAYALNRAGVIPDCLFRLNRDDGR